MKKLLFILTVILCCAEQGLQAQGMRRLFLDAPDEVFPLLTRNNRADCADYLDAGMEAVVTNRLGGVARMKAMGDDYICIEPSYASSVQVKRLAAGGDTLLCVVKSVRAEATDSRVSFYNQRWENVGAEGLFQAPAIEEFFVSADSAALYADRCDIYLVSLTLSPDDDTLTAEYTMPGYMNEEDAAAVRPLLRRIVYLWDGKRFVKE